jgi:hypothetical protein
MVIAKLRRNLFHRTIIVKSGKEGQRLNENRKTPIEMCALVHALCGMRWTGIKGKVKLLDLDAYIEAYRLKHTPVKLPKPLKPHKPTVAELKAEHNKKIIEMYNAGASYPEICHALNVSRSAVQQIIWRYNRSFSIKG